MAKREFDSKAAGNLPIDERGVNALEHVAHYLDRMESHLKKLANAGDGPPPPSAKISPFRRPAR